MHRSLIVARIMPGSQTEIARIFAASDATELPRVAGVRHRSLYSLGDLYIHLLETDNTGRAAVENARRHPEFSRVSDQLSEHVTPYLATWASPQDAIAECFYSYEPAPAKAEGKTKGKAKGTAAVPTPAGGHDQKEVAS